jgi:hypothetical protein
MYDLTLNIETEQSTSTFILPGIHENLRLAKPDGSAPITFEKSKNGNNFIAFNLLNPEGLTFVHTEYEPSDDDAEKLKKKQANLTKRLLHIGKKLVDESALKQIKTESFEQLAKSYINIIGDSYKGKLFRGKIIYNNKNYTTFPNYVPFLESMSVPTEASKLKMATDDKVVKTKADVIPSRPNPFLSVEPSPYGGVTATVENLPFG